MKVYLFSIGFYEYMISLANAMSNHCEVVLSLPSNRISDMHTSLIDKKVSFEPYTLVDYKSVRDNYKMLKKIKSILKKHNPEVVHVQAHGFKNFWLLLPFLRNKILINTIHDPVPHTGDSASKVYNWNNNLVQKFSDRTIVHGEFLKMQAIENIGLLESKTSVIPHGDLAIFKRWRKDNYTKEKNTFLFFGRIWPYKGLAYFIKAANLLVTENQEVRFIIAGKGEDFEKYDALIEDKSKFEIRNYRISEEEIDEIFQKANCVVLPYTDATQSGVIPIANHYGTFVIATKVGSLPEVVEDNITGLLVEPKNEQELFKKMKLVVENPEKTKMMIDNATTFSSEKLNWDFIASKTLQVYRLN